MKKRKGVNASNIFFGLLGILTYLVFGLELVNDVVEPVLPLVGDIEKLALQGIHVTVIIALLVFMFRKAPAEQVEFAE